MSDKIVEVECEWCASTFTDSLGKNYKTKKYCSKDCRTKGNASKYDHNTEICQECGDEFKAKPSHNRKYCSQDCMGDHRERQYSGKGNPNHKGEKETVCKQCNCTFSAKPSTVDERVFCSKECHNVWMSENQIAENSPRWNGGWRHGYGYNWDRQREKRLEKDDYECVVCGLGNEEHKERNGVGLHVHHIERKEKFRDENGELDAERANRIENLITVCKDCHGKWEGVPLKPQ